MKDLDLLQDCVGFQWDSGNIDKNWKSHQTTQIECEQVFFNRPLLLADDLKHSIKEKRYYVLGRTNKNRQLFIAFTVRDSHIRVISARDMSKKERIIYEQA
jgi:uncharacterized protein